MPTDLSPADLATLRRLLAAATPGLESDRRSGILNAWKIESVSDVAYLVLTDARHVAELARPDAREVGAQPTRSRHGNTEPNGERDGSQGSPTTSASGDFASDSAIPNSTVSNSANGLSGFARGPSLLRNFGGYSSGRADAAPSADSPSRRDSRHATLADSITSFLAPVAASTKSTISRCVVGAATPSSAQADFIAALVNAAPALIEMAERGMKEGERNA